MKYTIIIVFCLCGCGAGLLETSYTLKPPALPEAWKGFGEPAWQFEWLNRAGEKESRTVNPGETIAISPIQEWPSPVLARPFFPQRGIEPGILKPAGGIFPHDAGGNRMDLSWQGGVDASFYWALAEAFAEAGETAPESAAKRRPHYFDWPRFRALFQAPDAAENQTANQAARETVRKDPWLADWKAVAAKTVQSGFDSRRLVPETGVERAIPAGPGPWTGTSPFAPPLFFDGVPVFPLRSAVDTWYSDAGTLKCSTQGWIFYPD